MRVAWMALAGSAAFGGPHGRWTSAPLVLASETVANMLIEQMGPRWGLSRSTADAALGELQEDWLVDWLPPPPIVEENDNGTRACVGREVRRIYLTDAAIEMVLQALGLLNPEISGVPDVHTARDAALSGGERRAPLENAVPDRPPDDEAPPGEKSPAEIFREWRERAEREDAARAQRPAKGWNVDPGAPLPPDAMDRAGKTAPGKVRGRR